MTCSEETYCVCEYFSKNRENWMRTHLVASASTGRPFKRSLLRSQGGEQKVTPGCGVGWGVGGTSRCGYLCRIWTCRRRLALPILAPAGSSARLETEGQMKASLTSSLSRLQGRIVPFGNHVGTSCTAPQMTTTQITDSRCMLVCLFMVVVCCMCLCTSTD